MITSHLNQVWTKFSGALVSQAVQIWPKVLTGLIVFIVFWLAAIILQKLIFRLTGRAKRRRHIYELLGRVVKIALLVMGTITALGTMGVNVTALVTGLGLSGFALGLALKDPIANSISGFMLLLYEPFHVGDTIKISADAQGQVKEIKLRYTILNGDSKKILVPNQNLLTNVIVIDMASG